ncbi:cytochrome c oxidase assembly factor 5-like [Oppia nitens]|uniref:cytochrome c oxidase assembly factor 5-like n=1 Tax=Oppia nitens TaxID=1686743 RepID=UPI0023DADC68|nr:cytochrome c oxidase assembly factor 5-like [Oppia nitens]
MVRTYDTEEDVKGDGRSCSAIREDLKYCINVTDCVRKERKTPRQCFLEHHPSIPDECHQLKQLLFDCKRSLVDFRTRFRGRKGYSGIDI